MDYTKGVNVVEGQGYNPIAGVPTNISAMLINSERGPLNKATLVTSLQQLELIFGINVPAGTTGMHSARSFFKNAGYAPLYVIRIAASSALCANKTIQDKNGTPANTLKIEAKTEGAWGNYLQIEIKDDNFLTTVPASDILASAQSATLKSITNLEIGSQVKFDNGTNQEIRKLTGVNASTKTVNWSTGLSNAYPAATSTVKSLEFELIVYENGFQVEDFPNISMVNTVSNFCETVINHSVTGSRYIKVTDLKSTDTDEKDLPAEIAITSLASGADGLDDVTGSDYTGSQALKTGIYAMDEIDGLFRFCVPNPKLTDVDPAAAYSALVQDCIDYAELRKTVSFYADVPAAKSVSDAITWKANLESKNASLWYPWLTINYGGKDIDIPPSAAVMGAAVRKDASQGVHWNIGNKTLDGVVALEYNLSKVEDNLLNEANINTIMAKNGIRTYGGRTLSAEVRWRFVNDFELWCNIAERIMKGTQDILFRPIDAQTMILVERKLKGLCSVLKSQGAISWYSVTCNSDINPSDEVDQGILHAIVEYGRPGCVEKFVVTVNSLSGTGTEVS